MIDCTSNISYKAFAKARDERPWFRTLAPNQIKIVPRRLPHGIYVVTFEQRGRIVLAGCRTFHGGKECTPNKYGRWCYHVARAVSVLIAKQKRAEARAKAA
jgi:hypothetical protein